MKAGDDYNNNINNNNNIDSPYQQSTIKSFMPKGVSSEDTKIHREAAPLTLCGNPFHKPAPLTLCGNPFHKPAVIFG